MKSSINQIKNLVESLSNRLDQVEERLLGPEVDILEHSDNDKGKNKKEHTEHMRPLGYLSRPNL
jgi:hypothetical protein